jgi:hypothetical protein
MVAVPAESGQSASAALRAVKGGEGGGTMRRALGIMLLTAGIGALAFGAVTPSARAPGAKVGLLDVAVALGFLGGGRLVRRKA